MNPETSAQATKVCILFRLDDASNKVIEYIVGELLGMPNPAVKKSGELPYHMTIIGGGKIVTDKNLEATLREITGQLKPFSAGSIPRVFDVEPLQMFDDYLAIRLKLSGYVITGDRDKNKELLSLLQCRFHFDGPRHISLLRVQDDARYEEMDEKVEILENLLVLFRQELLAMQLIPEVWLKHPGSNGWHPWISS